MIFKEQRMQHEKGPWQQTLAKKRGQNDQTNSLVWEVLHCKFELLMTETQTAKMRQLDEQVTEAT